MFNPVSTYRIQFHKEFTFTHLEKIIPYLTDLGIKTLYASPVFQSVPGSTHGYDGVNPLMIDPEIGTLDQLKNITKKLKANGIGWLQDMVPNHMAYHHNNIWLMDLLEKGPFSAYKTYFDQSLSDELYEGPIMVPFLGQDLDEVIHAGELTIGYEDKFVFKYAEQSWPINLKSYRNILKADKTGQTDAVKQLLKQVDNVFQTIDPIGVGPAIDEIKLQLAALSKDKSFKQYIGNCLQKINGDAATLQTIAAEQYYRLCNWQETDTQINFRRFFTVNGLICLNIQNEQVFNHVHQLVASLLKEDIIQGLRIDHIDGLYDPAKYLQQLRALAGDEAYIVIEKILEPGEELSQEWPIQGSTGYDFLALVNNLFTNQNNEEHFTNFYKKLAGDKKLVEQQIKEKKALILSEHMNGELENLTRLFLSSDLLTEEELKNASPEDVKKLIGLFLIECPVYRFYGNELPLSKKEGAELKAIFKNILKIEPEMAGLIALLKKVFLASPENRDADYNRRALQFYQRCMQFTGPLMAKGVEDTLMYTYNRFIDHNEVGDSPDAFGLHVDEFHKTMQLRQQQWPLAINATATHDTKRGEGVRARLNVLTSIPDEWLQLVTEWQALNNDIKQNGAPDANDEYFIYQTLIGAYPMPGEDEDEFAARLQEYLEKMLREAKRHSNWAEPNENYEAGVKAFATALLDKSRPFWQSFTAFHERVSAIGTVNSLSQLLLKLTCPGVPDIYQGCELWDLSLVDPDNRRPVDYDLRAQLLNTLDGSADQLSTLWQNRFNGQIKLWLQNLILKERNLNPQLFSKGEYLPLQVKGAHKDKVMAFARVYKNQWLVIVVPVDLAPLSNPQHPADWDNTRIVLPDDAPKTFLNLFNKKSSKHQKEILIDELFTTIPLAVLKMEKPQSGRSAGILMHITSLPSPFGIGDLGPQARQFADVLHRSGQQYWQILPLNPTEEDNAHSPYSSYSSHAGNTLLISPELLVNDGLLDKALLEEYALTESNRIDFTDAAGTKTHFLNLAWDNYKKSANATLQEQFSEFCTKEAYWLTDFALYVALKQHHQNQPWNLWADDYKSRKKATLDDFGKEYLAELDKVKFMQFLFARQWHSLRAYCNNLDVKLFGDLPFYISYDSADVWTNPEIFKLNQALESEFVAGVPPDYFNENGQRWGMPVFNWTKLKATGYNWWIERIRKNLELYDLLRLDHFRAFASYWEIPASEETAVNGEWVSGPGNDLFDALKKEFGKLPFVAEDLGDIDDAVFNLRDNFKLPGMKVLQFAFGDDMPQSGYVPHHHSGNHLVYTGTHDNNTTLGWYRQDADALVRKHLQQYTGIKVSEDNICKVLIRMALASTCKTAIIPMQDWLNLDETARMNTPAAETENWTWRLTASQLADFPEKRVLKWMKMFDRL